jgi:hypothetical protein
VRGRSSRHDGRRARHLAALERRTIMDKLPPHVQAVVDEFLAVTPPLSPAQQRLIQRFAAIATAPRVAQAAEAS